MYYPDLSHECQVDRGPYVQAIGWLSMDHPFPKGAVPSEFLDALRRHLREPWQPVLTMGVHFCEFCPPSKNGRSIGGSRNLWIPGKAAVYVAPELVLHYTEAHSYRPPDAFIEATLNCPAQNSDDYRNQMRQFPAPWAEYLIDQE